jgi:hypothetical protein
MNMNRKGFFKTVFGGFVAASAAPFLIKAEETPQPPQYLSVNKEILKIDSDGNLGLGTSCPAQQLVVSSLVFQIGERKMLMAGDEDGNFKISWLDVKENESPTNIVIHQPKDDPWKKNFTVIR